MEEEFKFPDEQVVDTSGAKGKPEEDKLEIEVVDDTPEDDKGRTPMKEPPQDVSEDELDQYSDSVKKRIQHFSKGYHEERRAKEAALREREEAIRLAQKVMEENKRLQGNLGQGQQALLEQAKQVVASELDNAKRSYKEAYEAGDPDKLVEAQEALTVAKIKAERINNFKPPALQQQESVVQPTPQSQQTASQTQVDQKAAAWHEANPWFGSDDEMTAVALAMHKKLVESGVSPTSDDYYGAINKRVKQLFPDFFPDANPSEKLVSKKSNIVAPATRSTAPKKIVLTQSQVNIAKRLGVPLESYARQVAEEMRKQNG